jgi:hypothetical protein
VEENKMKLNDERRKALTEYLGDLTTASFERRNEK